MQQLPLKIAGQKANGFFPLKSSSPMAQFRLSNTKVALHGKHLKGRGRHRPTMKKGVAGSLQVGNQGRVRICFLQQDRGPSQQLPLASGQEAEHQQPTAPTAVSPPPEAAPPAQQGAANAGRRGVSTHSALKAKCAIITRC